MLGQASRDLGEQVVSGWIIAKCLQVSFECDAVDGVTEICS